MIRTLFGKDKRLKIVALLFGSFYSLLFIIGKAVYENNGLFTLYSPRINIVYNLFSFVGIAIFSSVLFVLIVDFIYKISAKKGKDINIKSIYIFLIIVFVYLTALFAFYPGVYSYDMMSVNRQALNIQAYTRFQPPLFTYIWLLCIKVSNLFNMEASTIYAIFQIVIVALFFTKLLNFIKKKNEKLFIPSFIFVAFNPVLIIFSIIPVKDVLFAVCFGLFVLYLYEDKCLSILFALLSCLLRNNMIYVLIVFLIILFFIKRKQSVVLVWTVVLFMLINGPLYNALGVEKGMSREKLSLPIQQIVLIVYRHDDKLDEETKNQISSFFYDYDSIAKLYNPRFVDDVKELFYSDYYDENKGEFWKLYLNLFVKYPNEFIVSFLDLNITMWYQQASAVDEYANRDYIEINIFEEEFKRDSKLPILRTYYEDVASYKLFEKIPFFINIFSISFPFWLMIFSLACSIYQKNKNKILILCLLLLLWSSYLLGPVSNCRYILPFIMLYPLLILFIFDNDIIVQDEKDI